MLIHKLFTVCWYIAHLFSSGIWMAWIPVPWQPWLPRRPCLLPACSLSACERLSQQPPHKLGHCGNRGHSRVCVCVSEILRWRASSVSDRFMSGVSVRSCESELQLTSVLTRSRLKPAKRQRSESGHSFCVSVCVSHDLKDVKGVFFWGERHCVLDANACVIWGRSERPLSLDLYVHCFQLQ